MSVDDLLDAFAVGTAISAGVIGLVLLIAKLPGVGVSIIIAFLVVTIVNAIWRGWLAFRRWLA